MIFIFTCSQCQTTDLVLKEFSEDEVLRLNIDKPEDFVWDFHRLGFRIVEKTSGQTIYGKLRQLLAAEKYFHVAPWHFFHGELPGELMHGRWVAKSMNATPIGQDKVFFVKEVNPAVLDLSYPWFVQERIEGQEEVTALGAFMTGCRARRTWSFRSGP